MIKKITVGLLILTMVLSFSGCGGKSTGEEITPITFTFYTEDGREDPWNDPVALAITEATGVTLETMYPSGQGNDILLMVATKEYPDLIFAKGDAVTLIDNDALIDMSDLIDEYGPNIKKLYGDEYDSLRFSKNDPSIYQLCSSRINNISYETSGTAQLQWAVIEYNDYKIPKTLDEFADMIREYRKKYATIDKKQTIGFTISVTDWHWYTTLSNPSGYIANGSVDNGQWIVNDDYSVTYKHAAEGQKEYYAWLNAMYDEGLLDRDFATQTHEDYIEKIASGRVLGLLDAEWDYSEAETSLLAEGMSERTYCGLPVTIDDSVVCPSLAVQGLAVGWGVGISKSCKDPVRAIQFLDYLCSDEGQILTHWGIEGVNYFYDENGVRYRTEEEILASTTDASYLETTGIGFHTYPFPAYGNQAVDETGNPYTTESIAGIKAAYTEEEKKALEEWNVDLLTDIFPQADEFDEFLYSPLWAKVLPAEIDEEVAILDEISHESLIECVICEPEDFDRLWEDFQQKLISAGRYATEKKMTDFVQSEVAFRQSLNKED